MESTSRLDRRRVRSYFVRWLSLTFVLWSIGAGWTFWAASQHAKAGEETLREVSDMSDPLGIDLEGTELALSEGRTELAAADEQLHSVILYPLRPLPFLGRQFSSARSLVRTALMVVESLHPLVVSVREAQEDSGALDRVAFLDDLAEQFGTLQEVAQDADLGPADNLVGPLVDGRSTLEAQLLDLETRSSEYQAVARGLALFLGGGEYLLLGSNNAEMRLGSGMHLSVGRLSTADGSLQLLSLTPSEALVPVYGASVLDDDVGARWGFLDLESDFRKLGYSARFDEHVAPQALELWRAKTGEELDGVILLDPFVLEALSGVLGDVEVAGDTYGQTNLLSFLLRDQYEELGNEFDREENLERRDRMALLAVAMVELFETESWDPLDLIRALAPVARGRHLMVFSRDEAEQAAWLQMGVAGNLTGYETGLFWLNTGGSKLDPYLSVSVDVVSTDMGETTLFQFAVTSTNAGNERLSTYAVGPWSELGLPEAGTYRGRFVFYAPSGSTDAAFVPGRPLDAHGPDGPLWLVSSKPMNIAPGETLIVRFEFSLPVDRETVSILPSGRFPAVQWRWDGFNFDDREVRVVDVASSGS